jgi:MFS transporter, FSR family, fosmidomycin resistance protein
VYPLLLLAPYGYTTFSIGILGAVLSAFSIVTSPLIGRRSDVGRNFVSLMSIGIIIMVVGLVGFALSMAGVQGTRLLFLLIVASAVAGLGSSFYHPIGAAILNETWTRKNRAFAMGVNGSMGTVGTLLLPIAANLAIVRSGIFSLVGIGGFGVAIAFVIYSLMRSAHFGTPKNDPLGVAENRENVRPPSTKSGVPLKIVLAAMFALTLVSFFRSVYFQGVSQFLPVYLYKVDRIPYEFVALAISVVPATGIVAQPLFGRLADKYDLRTIVALTSVGGVVAMVIFIFSPNFIVAEIFLGLTGAFQFTGFPLLLALASQIAPKGAVTLSNSVVWGLGTVSGGTLGPLLVGFLSQSTVLGSLTSAFEVLLVMGLAGLVFVPFIPKPARIAERVT